VTGLQVPDCAVRNGIHHDRATDHHRPGPDPPARPARGGPRSCPCRTERLAGGSRAAPCEDREAGQAGGRRAGRVDRCPPRWVAQGQIRRLEGRLGAPAAGGAAVPPHRPAVRVPTPEREVEYHRSDGRTVYVDFVFCRVGVPSGAKAELGPRSTATCTTPASPTGRRTAAATTCSGRRASPCSTSPNRT
jgi:hypothetical protein